MPYANLDRAHPIVTGQRGTEIAAIRDNLGALADGIISGSMPGYAAGILGGTLEQPQYYFFTKSPTILRLQLTWGTAGGATGQITQINYAISTDGGANYLAFNTETRSYDSAGNFIGSSGGGSRSLFVEALQGKFKLLRSAVDSLAAIVASFGTMASQASNNVAITGGNATLNSVTVKNEREVRVVLPLGNALNNIDWSQCGFATITVTGPGAIITSINLPAGTVGYVTLEIINGGLASNLLPAVKWPGGVPAVLTTSGRDIVTLMCYDAANVYVVGLNKAYA